MQSFCPALRLSIKAHLRRQRHIRQAQSLAEMPLSSICTFLGSLGKYFFDKLSAEFLPCTFLFSFFHCLLAQLQDLFRSKAVFLVAEMAADLCVILLGGKFFKLVRAKAD